jgi:hypothetical protein
MLQVQDAHVYVCAYVCKRVYVEGQLADEHPFPFLLLIRTAPVHEKEQHGIGIIARASIRVMQYLLPSFHLN